MIPLRPWFAWHPVRTDDGWTWLRPVLRTRLQLPGFKPLWIHYRRPKQSDTLKETP